jgi:uncharacterized protein with HEPN domain
MRDKLIDNYMNVDCFIVWQIIRKAIPSLMEMIVAIIDEYES